MFKRFIKIIAVVLFTSFGFQSQAVSPTPEQLKMFQQLSPEQQKQILEAAQKQQNGAAQKPLEQPEVVIPKQKKTEQEEQAEVTEEEQQQEAENKHARGSKLELEPFGYDLFAGTPTTFAPVTEIPVPVNYIIGPGDTVEVQLFGKANEQHSLVVTREGILNFPDIGPITVAGLTFSELKQNLQQRIKEQMIGVKASISMGVLRSIRVFILGDAERPGSYTVSALSTITNALFVSGGIKPIGSLRNIQLKRSGKVVKRLDLYDLLLMGDTRNDARLLPGDVIFVPPIGETVGVGGEVRRPAVYELKKEKTTGEIIKMAGGLMPTAYPQASQLERINAKHERTLVEIDLNTRKGKGIRIENGDVLRVYSVLEKMQDVVMLSGHVERPGGQQWFKGMRLSDVIASNTALLPKADVNYVLIKRQVTPFGKITTLSADIENALSNKGSTSDVLLQPRDEVVVFEARQPREELIEPIIEELRAQATNAEPSQEVSIGGRVHAPGTYPLEQGMKVSTLLRAAGMLKESAYVKEAELTRYKVVNGQHRASERIVINLAGVLSGKPGANITLQAHDHLVIQDIPQWSEREAIEIRGEVRFPGKYPIKRGETLASVLRRAGGVTDLAFVEGAVFMREELRKREQQQMDQLAARLESDISAASLEKTQDVEQQGSAKQAAELGKSLVQQLRSTKAAGRLVIDLEKIIDSRVDVVKADSEASESDSVILAKHNDILVVPRKTQSVTVLGEVHYPTSHIYNQSLARDDYVNRSGGITYKADDDRIYVVRANGEVVANNDSFWSFDNSSIDIKAGDTIIVPLDAERIKPLTLWSNVTQILYQVGVAVAAFNSAGIF